MAPLMIRVRTEIIGEVATGVLPDSNTPGKRTMNGFAIASLKEFHEDMLG